MSDAITKKRKRSSSSSSGNNSRKRAKYSNKSMTISSNTSSSSVYEPVTEEDLHDIHEVLDYYEEFISHEDYTLDSLKAEGKDTLLQQIEIINHFTNMITQNIDKTQYENEEVHTKAKDYFKRSLKIYYEIKKALSELGVTVGESDSHYETSDDEISDDEISADEISASEFYNDERIDNTDIAIIRECLHNASMTKQELINEGELYIYDLITNCDEFIYKFSQARNNFTINTLRREATELNNQALHFKQRLEAILKELGFNIGTGLNKKKNNKKKSNKKIAKKRKITKKRKVNQKTTKKRR